MFDPLIIEYDIVLQFAPSSTFFESNHPAKRPGERAEVLALCYTHKKDDDAFSSAKSSHALFLVEYSDGVQVLVPVKSYKDYRVWTD